MTDWPKVAMIVVNTDIMIGLALKNALTFPSPIFVELASLFLTQLFIWLCRVVSRYYACQGRTWLLRMADHAIEQGV